MLVTPPIGTAFARFSQAQRMYSAASSQAEPNETGWPHPIFASRRIADRKSVFMAHASHLPSVDSVPRFLDHLTSQPQLKRATHCMYAYHTSRETLQSDDPPSPPYSLRNPNSKIPSQPLSRQPATIAFTGQKDGGEGGSGDRLSRLLEDTRSSNVILVVSRWYGGVKLGNDRWKRINEVAKEALVNGGFPQPKEEQSDASRSDGNKAKGKKCRK